MTVQATAPDPKTLLPFPSLRLLGMRIDRVDMTTALEAIAGYVRDRTPRHIVTADASMIVTAAEDPEFAKITESADMVTADGAGILWASRRLGIPPTDKVSGVDLAARCCELSATNGWRIYFLGAGPGVAQEAARRIPARYPGAQIVGWRDGFFAEADEPTIVAAIRDAQPDILLVALGIPKQERFIDRNKAAMGVPVSIGVGGTLDVFSGSVKRAPPWMQNAGLEWLYRIAGSPRKRIKKAAALPRFALMTLRAPRS